MDIQIRLVLGFSSYLVAQELGVHALGRNCLLLLGLLDSAAESLGGGIVVACVLRLDHFLFWEEKERGRGEGGR